MPCLRPTFAAAALLCAMPLPAAAQEIYLGGSFHAVDLPTSLENGEGGGHDLQAGVRSAPIEGLQAIGSPSAYLHAQVSLDRKTSLAAVGLSWKVGKGPVYVRPGIGLAVNTDRMPEYRPDGTRIDLGSRVLFEPELALGLRISERVSGELSWVHTSHAQIFGGQNPGMDFLGARLVFKLK
ncbi:MAG: acyloxyacyl hydrolase [Novosphingobium sp.]